MTPALPISGDVAARLSGIPLSVLLDIDGTLAAIAPRPQDATVSTEMLAAVSQLTTVTGTHVAVVTGRSVSDARRLVPVPHVGVIGNHGFEVLGEDGEVLSEPAAHSYLAVVRAAADRLAAPAREIPGVVLEDKKWTLSLHYRLVARSAVPGLIELVDRLAAELGLVVTTGKEVLEMRPPLPITKGTAAVLWVKKLGTPAGGSTLYIGDDRTDEDAFRELRKAFARAVSIRVGDPDAGETTAAEFRVETPADVRQFLVELAALRRGGRAATVSS